MLADQRIVPCIWSAEADEMADFYLSVFGDSAECVELGRTNYPTEGLADFQQDMAGKSLTVGFSIGGLRITALNAGHAFRPTPMLSFIVNLDPSRDDEAAAHLDEIWKRLTDGGEVRMELGEYPFSPRYGWVEDRFGVSWQLMLTNPDGDPRPFLIPSFMFANANVNRANEALVYYTAILPNSQIGTVATYPEAQGEVDEGSVMFADFALGSQWFAVMDSPVPHDFEFTEGLSLQVECADQSEIDYFWEKLSHVPESEQCGWCKDQFGVSWQVVPRGMDSLMTDAGFRSMMQMKKIVIDELA